ncbi:MAG: VWA domain-containing protein [Candidatus Nealsonbacteria bacterium]|nr:VWA domain-containing protein [Candidatus Nealsonbacteria bacterium]
MWCAVLMLAVTATPSWLMAAQVKLDVSMAQPTLLAEKKQTTFVKVGLTGFKMSSTADRTPVNVSLVLDKSGSMSGTKIAKAKEAAIWAVRRLDSNDIVSVVVYDSTVRVLVPATKLTDKEAVCRKIREISSGGSTALFAGVSKGAAELRKFIDRNRVNRVILLSDGLANVGPQTPSALGELGSSLIKEGISVSTMGLGLGYNEDLMSQLAQRSDGNHIFIEKAEDLAKVFNFEFDHVLSVVAQEVSITINISPEIRPVRVLGREAEINGRQVIVKLNQLYSEQEKYVMLEVELPPSKAGKTRQIAQVDISYANMETKTTDRLSSTVSVNFDLSKDVVQRKTKAAVMAECVLQVANEQNKLATALRDKGDVAGARRVLEANGRYLGTNADLYKSEKLRMRSGANLDQAKHLDGKDWARSRKSMRLHQHEGTTQQLPTFHFSGGKR